MLSLVIGAAVLTKALVMSTLPAVMVQYAVDGGFGFWGVVALFVLVVVVMGLPVAVALSAGLLHASGTSAISARHAPNFWLQRSAARSSAHGVR